MADLGKGSKNSSKPVSASGHSAPSRPVASKLVQNKAKEDTKLVRSATARPAARQDVKPIVKREVHNASAAPSTAKKGDSKSAPVAQKQPIARTAAQNREAPAAQKHAVARTTVAPAPRAAQSDRSKTSAVQSKTAPTSPAKPVAPVKASAPTVKREIHDSSAVPAVRKDDKAVAMREVQKPAKREVAPKRKPTKQTAAKSGATAKALDPKKKKLIIIGSAVLAAVIILVVVLCCVLSCRGDSLPTDTFVNRYANKTAVGYSAEYLGETSRRVPTETSDEGLVASGTIPAYPGYAKGVSMTLEQRQALIAENWGLLSIFTRVGSDGYPKNTYDKIDKDGNFYLQGLPTGKKLYKHTGADNMYRGTLSDDEPAIIKRLTYTPRGYGSYNVTGVYAPAGEVIEVRISKEDMEATDGIVVFVGQALYNYKANNIWAAKGVMNRMPVILNTMNLTTANTYLDETTGEYVGYAGSHFGGPVYIGGENVKFSVTISGAVRYSHFILGYTTPEEYEINKASTAPYFDLEVREYGVLHSGPKVHAERFSYDEIYDAAVLWEKISLVSTRISRQGIVFIYDPFVAAGAAVAFPGQRAVNCPDGWMGGSLNYKSFVNSGAWGNMHEYNHNFQGWGLPGGGEVTNNAVNLVEYSLFTRISGNRRLGAGGDGMGGWNRYTSASWAATQVIGRRENDLSIYATLLHAFGQDNFMQVSASRAGGVDGYFNKFADVTHNDMTYYASLVGKEMSAEAIAAMKAKNYSVFVPVASIYQTGRSYMYDGEKRYTSTMQPYEIPFDKPFDIDLNKYTLEGGMYKSGSIVLPDGFSYRIKSVGKPEYGSLTEKEQGIYTYTPDPRHLNSGNIIVTLELTKDDGSMMLDDVDLVLALYQSHEMNKNMLTRTVYTFDTGTAPASTVDAFESGFEGYKEMTEGDNVNPVQNGNTEIWSRELLQDGTYYVVSGKMHVDETTKYRMALRGRWDCALYTSVNNEDNYTLSARVLTDKTHASFYTEPETYHDFTDLQAGDWVYFKAVLKGTHRGGTNAYIGLGWGKFVPPAGVIDEDGNLVGGGEETVTVQYATAYRDTYEFPQSEFTSDYFYTRTYTYSYRDEKVTRYEGKQAVLETNFEPWGAQFVIDHLFDGDPNTTVHTRSHNAGGHAISNEYPLVIDIDAGGTVTYNCLDFFARNDSQNIVGLPRTFKIEFRDTVDGEVKATKQFTNVTHPDSRDLQVHFGENITFRYYKVTITGTENGYFATSGMGLSNRRCHIDGERKPLDDEQFVCKGDWSLKSGLYTFGHLYEGRNNAVVQFEFTGTCFALFSVKSPAYGSMEVLIDGKSAGTTNLAGDGSIDLSYLSDELTEGKHSVTIICSKGVGNIDSIVIW